MNFTPNKGYPYLNRYTDPLTYGAVSGEDYLLPIDVDITAVEARLAALEAVATELGDDYTPYVPTWTGITGAAPVPATHSLSGRWKKYDRKLALVEFRLVGLSPADWGGAGGVYGFGLPFAITATSRDMASGTGHMLDSGLNEYPCICRPHDTTTVRLHHCEGGTHNVGATVPFTLTTNDTIRWSILVEPA